MIVKYPKTLKENLEYRTLVFNDALDNLQRQEFYKEACRRSRLYWINVFVWTFDPRRHDMTTVPFITYDFQDDLILWDVQCCQKAADNLVEKSRDMGITWSFVANDVYDWLFSEEKIEIKWGSRNQDYVDKRGEMDSIFEKIRFLLQNLPNWMLPEGFEFAKHDNFMRLINPVTGSAITGEATSANFGRGGRKLRIRFDEFAFWENASGAWQAAADSTRCRTALSTVNGSANKFAELAHSGIAKKTLHWSQHPGKNKDVYKLDNGERTEISVKDAPNAAYEEWLNCRDIVPPQGMVGGIIRSSWYDDECERRGKAKEIAEELDIDYLRSGSPFFDNRAVKFQPIWTEYVPVNHLSGVPQGRFVRGIVLDIGGKYTFRNDRTGWCKLYEAPYRGGQYVIGGDVAEGLEKEDESTLVVRDKYTRHVVAVVNGAYPPEVLAVYAQKLGQFYNRALVAIENNNHGYSTNEILSRLDCNIYWTRRKGQSGEVVRVKRGFSTTQTSRPLMLDIAREEVAKQACEVRDEQILGQMLTFVHNDKTGKPEADGSFKDDCLKIGTLIKTNEGYKPIENIKVGEFVLTHRNRYKKVECIIKKPFNNLIYRFKFRGQVSLEVTYNHPLLAVPAHRHTGKPKNDRLWKFPQEWKNSYRCVSVIEKFEESKVIKLNEKDFFENSRFATSNILKNISINENFARFLGLFLAEGNCSNSNYTMSLAFHSDHTEQIEEMLKIVKGFGISARAVKDPKCNSVSIIFSSKFLWHVMKHCYNKEKEKIFPWWGHSLGIDKKTVLEYWLQGDGWIDNSGSYERFGASTSRQLALEMRDIAWSSKFYAIISQRKNMRYGIRNKDIYYVAIKSNRNGNEHIKKFSDNEFGSGARFIEKEYFKGDVYNLQVADDRSFIANGIVVHNCIIAHAIAGQVINEHPYKAPVAPINTEMMNKQFQKNAGFRFSNPK